MGIASRLKKESRALRKDLNEIAEAPLFYFATESGTVVLQNMNVSGRRLNVTFGFSSHGEAKGYLDKNAKDFEEDVFIRRMACAKFLGLLFHHLNQSDIDILLSDKEKPYPLTTMGVNALQDPLWLGLLDKAREDYSKNVLLTKVSRDIFETCGGPSASLTLQNADYKAIVRALAGHKGAALPSVDLRLVWFLTQPVEGSDEVEPIMIQVGEEEDRTFHENVECLGGSLLEGETSVVGPLCFSSREAAMRWAELLPPHLSVYLMSSPVMITAERGDTFLSQISERFPSFVDPEFAPDSFTFDGAGLPLSLLGARYVESKINYLEMGLNERPDRNWISVAEGKFASDPSEGITQCRNMAVKTIAQELGLSGVRHEHSMVFDSSVCGSSVCGTGGAGETNERLIRSC